jgi:hypothetical protein
MIRTTNSIYAWRRVGLLFAAFFCLALTIISCKKKKSPIGQDALPSGSEMSSAGIDTFQLKTYTVKEDSVISMDPEFNIVGSYNDPVFGPQEANFYTQLKLSGFSPDFGDLTQATIDSCVLAFEYGGYYGELSEQLFKVYEISDELTRDSTYKRTSTVPVNSQQLVPTSNNQGRITPAPFDQAVVGADTLNPQLRIPIDTTFGRQLLQLAEGSTNDEDFLQNFNGLFVKVNNGMQSPDDGSIVYLATSRPASKLTVYYTQNGDQEKFDFIVNGQAIDFNHFDNDFSGTRVEQVINDSTLGQEEYYAQAFTTRAKIDFKTIDSLPKDIIVHKATLELPVSYYLESDIYPSSNVIVSAQLFAGDDRKYIINEVTFQPSSRSYIIDLRTYVQNIIKGEIVNNGVFVSPKRYNTTAERIIFNGVNTPNKKKPKLNIVYTKL